MAALLAEVEATVQEKKAQSLYNPTEVRRVEETALDLSRAADDRALAELSLHQTNLQQLWDPKACGVVTHRGGLAGRLMVGAKRLLHRITSPYLNIVLARQTAFNGELVKLLNVMVPRHADLLRCACCNPTSAASRSTCPTSAKPLRSRPRCWI